jgi:hypothetical protein
LKKQLVIVGIAVLLVCVGLSGCITDYEDIIIDDNYYQNAPRDHFVFNSVKLRQDLLILNVSYGGGCEEHEFVLIATSFMESNPVQVNVVLSHEDNDDPCDAWITEELVFSLLPLKKAWQDQYNKISGKIIINLENWIQQISYEF